MRWMALTAMTLVALGTAPTVFAQTAPVKKGPPTSLPKPVAEPENDKAYARPLPIPQSGPTDADRGPAQRHFVLAADEDDLATTQVADNASLAIRENISLDKRIKIPLVHDVQNDASYHPGENNALDFELTYLNWGAVTEQQKQARHGHYFTITAVNDGPKGDYTACFEYRQVKSQEIVRKLTQPLLEFSGTTRSYFGVVDRAYLAYGPVCSWRFTILKGDTIVAQTKSYIW